MANSKQKPVPEGTQRRPGKSKFSIPRREAPPVDGSYLDRLFADYEKQTKELEGQPSGVSPEAEAPAQQQVTEFPQPAPAETAAPSQTAEASPAEASESRPSEVSIPLRPQQIIPAETEELADTTSAEASAAGVTADVQTTDEVSQTPPAPARPEPSFDDEPLIERWKRRHRLSKGEVKVLRVMVRMCREAGGDRCFVKIPQLMAGSELKERQTQLVLRSLRELGLIEKVAEYSNANRMGTQYRVVFDSE